MRTFAILALSLGLVTPAGAAAQALQISNAQLQTLQLTKRLGDEFRTLAAKQTAPAWFVYTQPIVDPELSGCCQWSSSSSDGSSCCVGCFLEPSQEEWRNRQPPPRTGPIPLERAKQFLVLIRVEAQEISRIRTHGIDCPLDAGGLPVFHLTNVSAADSLAFLESLAATAPTETGDKKENTKKRWHLSAVTSAIAQHADPQADAILERFAAPERPEKVRRDAIFWLARARGARGFDVVQRAARQDASINVRKHAVFALTITPEPRAVDTLIDLAQRADNPTIRGEALFWLANKAQKKAIPTLTRAIESDPDSEVKKRAVFGLSRLPKDEGVPLLIQIARTNTNPVVRKQAMFWLGQSKDPRAIEFFASVLRN